MPEKHVPVRPTYVRHPRRTQFPPAQKEPVQQRVLTPVEDTMDPDFKRVVENSNKAAKTKHAPTKEEQECGEDKSSISWVMIIFAVMIIALVIAIAWLVLRDNGEEPDLREYIAPGQRVRFQQPVAQVFNPPPLQRPSAVKPVSPVAAPVAPAVKPESPAAESPPVAVEQALPAAESPPVAPEGKMKLSAGSTLYDPVLKTASEGELFEILEGSNDKYAKKKRNPKKKSGPSDEEEDTMVSNYYNEVQDSDEENYEEE